MTNERIEALDIVALAIDERRRRGTLEHVKALRILEEAKALWHEQRSGKKKCPHCGHELR